MAKAKASRSERTIPPLLVRYPRRMKPQRVYAVQVSWRSREKSKLPAGTEPFTLRLIMAGAQVVPSEQSMDPAKPAAKATFYVTALARRGWLKGERLEVLSGGEKVQEIALPTKVATQRRALIFLLLSFLLPWFLGTHLHLSDKAYFQIAKNGAWKTQVGDNFPALPPDWAKGFQDSIDSVGLKDAWGGVVLGLEAAFGWIPAFYEWLFLLLTRDELATTGAPEPAYLPFWTFTVFLILALFSAFTHRQKFRKKVGLPLPLPEED